jgi:hypothetical protein
MLIGHVFSMPVKHGNDDAIFAWLQRVVSFEWGWRYRCSSSMLKKSSINRGSDKCGHLTGKQEDRECEKQKALDYWRLKNKTGNKIGLV